MAGKASWPLSKNHLSIINVPWRFFLSKARRSSNHCWDLKYYLLCVTKFLKNYITKYWKTGPIFQFTVANSSSAPQICANRCVTQWDCAEPPIFGCGKFYKNGLCLIWERPIERFLGLLLLAVLQPLLSTLSWSLNINSHSLWNKLWSGNCNQASSINDTVSSA
jgi:hypothetical protein